MDAEKFLMPLQHHQREAQQEVLAHGFHLLRAVQRTRLASPQNADVLLGLIQQDWRPRCGQEGQIFSFPDNSLQSFLLSKKQVGVWVGFGLFQLA